jgi:N-methylhydantoinase A/oxoprolinase/acetone carboxylase beta subunit
MNYRISVDIGGTFTDCVVVAETGRRNVAKALTSHGSLTDGVIESVSLNAAAFGLSLEELLSSTDLFAHGTTVATNAMLVHSGARVGLITTRGHEDALFIGKVYAKRAGLHERDAVHASRLGKPFPIVPRELVRGIPERIDVEGDVVVPLTDDTVLVAIDSLVEADVDSIAVCLLWSFVNDSHERRIRELLRERAPHVFASFSHELAPVMGEYERAATTAVNAYVGPKVVGYLEALQQRLRDSGLRHPLLVMQASGGLTSVSEAAGRPITTLDSGPTGGVLGCSYLGRLYGEDNIVCTDVGGTSFDVGVIANGEVPIDTDPVVSQYTLRMPKVSVHSIGAGGGSVVWIDDGGLLRVGPRSAGSRPGPACYGSGGTEPTVTDADLILGYIDAGNFLGGRMQLDRDRALAAFAKVGREINMEPEEAAWGAFQIVNAQMSDLIRKSTIEMGYDPRECVLVAYGGSGPTHAAFYGADINAKGVLIVPDSTAFSAEGMLTCGISHSAELSRLVRSPIDTEALEHIQANFDLLIERVLAQFTSEGVGGDIELTHSLGIRYRLQVHSLEVEVTKADLASGEQLLARFHERYARKYGSGALLDGGGVEIERHRVTGRMNTVSVTFHTEETMTADGTASAVKSSRPICFGSSSTNGAEFVPTDIYEGSDLRAGQTVPGPAVIERMGASVVVPPGLEAWVDQYLTLNLRRTSAATVEANLISEVVR